MSSVNSIATSINKLVAALLGEAFSGDVKVDLSKDNLAVSSGKTSMSAVTNGVIYQKAESELSVLKDGSYIFKFSDGYIGEVTAAEKPAKAPVQAKKVTGGHSSARPARSFD